MKSGLPFIIGIPVLLGFSLPAQPQHQHELEEIVVTARPAGEQGAEHIPQPVDVLAGDELREKMAASVGETLSQELGVSSSDFGQGAGRPVIRGLGGARVRVLQDGIGSMDVSTVSADHAVTIDPMHSEQIEILRGPATLLYGSDAFGGLVNVANGRIPSEIPGTMEAQLDARHNTAFDERTAAFRAEGGIESLALHLDALHRNTGDYEAGNGEVPNSAIETSDVNVGMSGIGERGFAGASFGRYQGRYGIPPDPRAADEQLSIDQEQERFDLSGAIHDPLPGFVDARLRVGYVDYAHTEFEGPGEPGTRFYNEEWEGRAELRHAPLGGWGGTLGLHYRNRSFDTVGEEAFVPGTKLRSLGIFVLESSDWNDWHFEIGGRYEEQDADPTEFAGAAARSHELLSGSAGAVWNFSDRHSLSLALTRAQRAPAIEELYARGPHLATGTFELGDDGLREETSSNLDLSASRNEGSWTWTLNLYVNRIDDFIFQQEVDRDGDGFADEVDEEGAPGGDLLLIGFRQDTALFYGLEAESRFDLFNDARGHLDLRIWGDWVRAKLVDAGDLPRIPPGRLGAGLEYNRGPWHLDTDAMHVFGQDRTGVLEDATGGYTLIAAGFSRDLEFGRFDGVVYLRGTNLLDETARRHTSFLKDRAPLPGRALTLGISVDL